MSSDVLPHLFRYNAWATQQLIEFCGKLDPGVRSKTAAGVYGTIDATFGHILGAEKRYFWRATGEELWEGQPGQPGAPDAAVGYDQLAEWAFSSASAIWWSSRRRRSASVTPSVRGARLEDWTPADRPWGCPRSHEERDVRLRQR